MFWILLLLAIAAIGYWKLKHHYSYWTRKGVSQGKPVFFLGDTWRMIFRRHSPPEMTEIMYNYDKDARYVGVYQFLSPELFLRDPELIKQIVVKDFDHFLDHKGFTQVDADPLLGKTLFSLSGQEWREMRSTLSPSFTSSKMKYLFSVISQIGEQFVGNFLEKEEKMTTVEMRDVLSRFANDVIANSVFGFKCDSVKDPTNEFFTKGSEATDFRRIRTILVFLGYMVVPRICAFFKLTLFSDKMTEFFNRLVKENIESRVKHGVVRPDMISLLLEARKTDYKHEETAALPDTGFATVEESEVGKNQKLRKTKITDEDITSQAFQFFFAGFDSVSSLLSFMSYELAVNQEIQARVRQEVDDVKEECNGKITYEAITTMQYMDMVVSETLRKWPNAISTDRICTKPYTIQPKALNETPLTLNKGDVIWIPVYAIHRDPKYYPDPDRFDPERFSEENKNKIIPYTYLPFGTGPRNCIGSRFALLETKILFYYLLSSFEIVPVEKTQIPIRFDKKAINMSAEKGIWLGLVRREV